MGTLLFIFKLIFSPVKVIYQMMTGKKRKTHFLLKPLKLCLTVVFIIFSISVILAAMNEQDIFVGDWRSNGTSIVPVEIDLSEIEDESLLEQNPDGTMNGLNLQLINLIEAEGYVKEYLTLCLKLQNGELGELFVYPDVARTLGVAATEQGSYSGLPILGSPLPLVNGSPLWDKSKNMTLSTAYSEDYQKYGYSSSFVESQNSTGWYYGGWQVRLDYKSQLSKTVMSKKSEIDTYYFPDQMYSFAQLRNWKYTNVDSYFGDIEISDGVREMITSILYSGSPIYKYLPGNTPEEKAANAELIYRWTEDVFIKDYYVLLSNEELCAGSAAKFIAIMLNVKNGGKISQETYNYCVNNSYQRRVCNTILSLWGISQDLNSYLGAALDTSLPPQGNYSGIMTNVIDGKTYYMVPESTGHFIGEEVLGRYYYGSMLKYAGINVDPTDPNTYMNTLPEGEWKPGGDSVWMSNYPEIDKTKLNSKREAFLNEAYKWLGSWYAWGGTNPPVKDSNGEWKKPSPVPGTEYYDPGFDCSRYVQYCAQVALGIDITRATPTQQSTSMMEDITRDEAKPGDLVYCYPAGSSTSTHVYIYLGKTSDGFDLMMHAPRSGKTLEIRVMNYPDYYGGGYKYRRIKGIDS